MFGSEQCRANLACARPQQSMRNELCSQEETFLGHVGGGKTTSLCKGVNDEVVGVLELVEALCSSESAVGGVVLMARDGGWIGGNGRRGRGQKSNDVSVWCTAMYTGALHSMKRAFNELAA